MAFTMTSLPWSENKTTYNDDTWSDTWRKLFVRDRTTQGVLDGYENELEVTNPSGTTIRVATGAAFVDGKFTENATQQDFTGVAPGSGSNFYRVVFQKVWADEEVYLDILGPNVVAPPAVTQTDAVMWEISLGTVEITSGSVVTVTDTRAFCFTSLVPSRTRQFLLQATLNLSGGAIPIPDDTRLGQYMADAVTTNCSAFMYVPNDYEGDLKIYAIVVPEANGDIYSLLEYYVGADGESYNLHSGQTGPGAYAVSNLYNNVIMETDLSAVVNAGDIVRLEFSRSGSSPLDTINNKAHFTGFLVTYTTRDND